MNKFTLSLALLGFTMSSIAQNIGMGTLNPDPSAQVEISSNSRGLLIPRMDSTTIAGIKTPARGLMVYDTARNQLLVNMGTAAKPDWRNLIEGSGWSLTGNDLDDSRQQFIGPRNNRSLNFRLSGMHAGTIDDSSGLVSLGVGTPVTNPKQLSAGGNSGTTAVGYRALENLTGNETVGVNNTALGSLALNSMTIGIDNTAVGRKAMTSNIDGNFNTSIGHLAMINSMHASNNTAIGWSALLNTDGSDNTAVGYNALDNNITGVSNTAVGVEALSNESTTSSFNTALGYHAGQLYAVGSSNVFIGAFADVSGANLTNVVALGEDAICTASNQVRIGNTQTKTIGGFVNWTNFSDGRFKKNMKENVKGLDFIMRLRPITYTLDMDGIEASLRPGRRQATTKEMQGLTSQKAALVTTGFVAQEVEKAASDAGYEFSGVDKPKNEGDFYGLRYAEFVAPLVKAVQEQQHIIEELRRKIDTLEKKSKQ